MIKVSDFENFKTTVELASYSVMKKIYKLNAVVDVSAGQISYIISDSDGKKDEYKTLESAVLMYNKAIG